MAIRPIPKQSILDCLPTAVESGDLRIDNRALNFIQNMTKRADDLTSQALSTTDYTQLVKITDNYTKLADRASVKAQTLQSSNIEFFCRDFEAVLHDIKKGDFVYFDPPYQQVRDRKSTRLNSSHT